MFRLRWIAGGLLKSIPEMATGVEATLRDAVSIAAELLDVDARCGAVVRPNATSDIALAATARIILTRPAEPLFPDKIAPALPN